MLLSMVKEAGVVSPCWVKLCVHVYVCVYFLFCHQILFSFADAPLAIQEAVITMQLEVARRLVAQPNCKDYGILSVVFQLYTTYVATVSWHICSQLMSVLHILHVCIFAQTPNFVPDPTHCVLPATESPVGACESYIQTSHQSSYGGGELSARP